MRKTQVVSRHFSDHLVDSKQIGPWEIGKKLGAGGMGTVYLGTHNETGKQAAVKVLPASLAREEGFVERFKREIASMEQLKSPHIVEFYESGNDGDIYFYAMEYVDGETLTSRLKRDKRIPWQEVIDLCLQICRALKAAHNSGIIHRDLKPSNLMLASDGTVKLTDFGVAQVFASQKLTVTGGIVGTAEYMSPEQAKGQRATKKSDLYSLGAVMYVMLTGRPPFSGKTSLDVIHKHQFATFDRPGLYATDMPRQLEEVVCKLLEKDPDNRYPDSYVLSLRLAEVQKRYAWQNVQKAAEAAAISGSGAPSTAYDAELTQAGDQARVAEDGQLAPTVLIPDALGKNVPLGATIPTPAGGLASAHSPAMGATLTSPSAQREATASDATRHLAPPSQGPGTIMRNLMRKALSEQQDGGAIGRVFDKFWVQVTSLLLLIVLCVWFFLHPEPTQDERYNIAIKIMQQDANTEWILAKEHFKKLVDKDPARWQELVDPHLKTIDLYETKLRIRARNKGSAPTSEPQRQLELAQEYFKIGDDALAERKLDAILVLTKGQDAFQRTYKEALDLRDVVRQAKDHRAVRRGSARH
ncbi:MAG: serine/threonine protein kinase bacterial [Planctomycetota bacterium]|nr:MAG: serine/threonine protein kinase bacterial [Planctomycetota bacterium]